MNPETSTQSSHSASSSSRLFLIMAWVVSLAIVGGMGFVYGKSSVSNDATEKKVAANGSSPSNLLVAQGTEASPTTAEVLGANSSPAVTPTLSSAVCAKTGFAQKWDYLTPYVIQQNDTIESIATTQLKDASRVNEILQINGVGPLVVGSTLYLPPSNIPKSSGNLREVFGKLVEKNDASWHISFTADTSGQGLLIPSFLFQSVQNKDTFQLGDCLKVFFDDGYTVYSVSLQ